MHPISETYTTPRKPAPRYKKNLYQTPEPLQNPRKHPRNGLHKHPKNRICTQICEYLNKYAPFLHTYSNIQKLNKTPRKSKKLNRITMQKTA